MSNETIDWADVAAVGVMHLRYPVASVRLRVSELLGAPTYYCSDLEREHLAIASALREAFEAGLRERIDVLDCDACGERHMTERGAAMASENRELRRELAARRAVDGWIRENGDRYLEVGVLSGRLNACEGLMRLVASAPTYPALAAALGLEVEDD